MHDGEQSQDPVGPGPHGQEPGQGPAPYPPPAPDGFVAPQQFGQSPQPPHSGYAPAPGYGGYGAGPVPTGPGPGGATAPQWSAGTTGYGPAMPGGAPEGRSRGALIGAGVAALLAIAAVVVVVTGFWVPGYFTYTALDTESVENGITEYLRDAGEPVDVGSVTCPGDIRVTVDDTFTCRLEIDGAPHTVTSTILDTQGTYRVGAPAAR